MKVAIYTRTSIREHSGKQSLHAQLECCQTCVAANDWTITGIYEEKGCAGKTERRPSLQRLLGDAEAGQFEGVIVHERSRLSRRPNHMTTLLEHLTAAGVRLVSISENAAHEERT